MAITLLLRYSPGQTDYTLTADTLSIHDLSIHDRFYPVTLNANAVDVEHIRVVDQVREPDWRVTARTNGFSNGGYSSGSDILISGESG